MPQMEALRNSYSRFPGRAGFLWGMRPVILSSLLAVTVLAPWAAGAETVEADIVVYGGSAGGVAAACTAAKAGKTAVVAEFGKHIGGLTSGGLGYTDIGNKAAIGGFSHEFYKRLGKHYGKAEAWTFEPSVAEKELRALLDENKVPVKFAQRLASVKKSGASITEITMEDGTVYHGKMFIDATYEGDLMAKAGVKYMVGREANERFTETLNGVRGTTPSHQFGVDVDPYVKPGDPASGLLPFIQAEPLGTPGAGDPCVQAYNFRLCFTKKAENKITIEPPAGYDPKQFELLGRYCEALTAGNKKPTLKTFLKIDMVTADKTDINNNGAFSTDYIGKNYSYPDASYAEREKLWAEHLRYINGLITFLKTDPRVPENVRAEMAEWGLCKDEFADTAGWPNQMYVREARRMMSDYIMTEKVCRQVERPDDSVGLGAYNMDSHNCRRIVVNGKVRNEGDVQVGVRPYPISYRSIIPRGEECDNLFVPICLSATHIAYGSIRMEPVFMILGESSALAAVIALDDKVPVQKVVYAKLHEALTKAGQVLVWNGALPGQTGVNPGAPAPKLPGIVLDDTQAEKKGEWKEGNLDPRVGAGYLHDDNANKGSASLTWTLEVPEDGRYDLNLYFPPNKNRATNVPVGIATGSELRAVMVNEQTPEGVVKLGNFNLTRGAKTTVTIRNDGTTGHVIADGLQAIRTGMSGTRPNGGN